MVIAGLLGGTFKKGREIKEWGGAEGGPGASATVSTIFLRHPFHHRRRHHHHHFFTPPYFHRVGSAEGQFVLRGGGQLTSFSEEMLIDCIGWDQDQYGYFSTRGFMTTASYP